MPDNYQQHDDTLRRKLAELPLPEAPVAGWERLQSALETDADLALRDALTGLAAGSAPSGWQALQNRLDGRSAADADLAAALDGLRPVPPAGGWATLEQKLDDALGEEVDAIVGSHLAREAGRTSGWAALAARLELISHRRQLVGAWKVMEFGLLASLVLLLLRFGPAEAVNHAPVAGISGSFPLVETFGKPTAGEPENGAAVVENAAPVLVAAAETEAPAATPAPVAATTPTVAPAIAVAPLPRLRTTVVTAPVATLPTGAVASISGPAYTAEWGGTLPSPPLVLPAVDHSVPVRYHLNLFTSPTEVNQVITPANTVKFVEIDGGSTFSHSSSVGALLDISHGNDGLRVGAVYGIHGYEPSDYTRQNCFVENLCPEAYDRFIYHSLDFVFGYERGLLTTDKWRLSTNFGMAMSVTTNWEFLISEQSRDQLALAISTPGSGERSAPSNFEGPVELKDLLEPQRVVQGWFQGGSLLDNSSFYLNGGFTAERLLTPRLSVYLSPNYGRVIYLDDKGGVGPHNDRIHRAGLRMGTRILLSNK